MRALCNRCARTLASEMNALHGEHSIEGYAGIMRSVLIDFDLIDHVAVDKVLQGQTRSGAMRNIVAHTSRVRGVDELVGIRVRQPVNEVEFSSNCPCIRWCFADRLDDVFSRTVEVGFATTSYRHSGCTRMLIPGYSTRSSTCGAGTDRE